MDSTTVEKELRVSPGVRSIRMDVVSMDEQHTVYNTEMQKVWKADLTKRSRYYQSVCDTSLLEPGVPNYNRLNNTYIIMITPFDLFGYGKYCYTFEARCNEVPECILGDDAVRIFLNTRGTNDDEVSKELVDFLHYVEHTTDESAAASDSERIHRIHERVQKVRMNEEIGVKYMQAWEENITNAKKAVRKAARKVNSKNWFLRFAKSFQNISLSRKLPICWKKMNPQFRASVSLPLPMPRIMM